MNFVNLTATIQKNILKMGHIIILNDKDNIIIGYIYIVVEPSERINDKKFKLLPKENSK